MEERLRVEMNTYIFITAEGFTYQPGSEAIGPDIENCQVIGFGQGGDEEEAFENLVKENKYLLETSFDEVFCMELKHQDYHKYSKYFSLAGYRGRKPKSQEDEYIRKVRLLTEKEEDDLVDDCECCHYCGEPFKECDTLIPGVGVVVGETDVVKYLGKHWHFGCICDWHKEKQAG